MLQACLAAENIDVCILQETLLRETVNFRMPGYRVFSLPQEEGRRGLVTLVRSGIPAEQWEDAPERGEGVKVLGVRVQLLTTVLKIVNLCRPAAANLELGEMLTEGASNNLLLGGDFNAHHPALGSNSTTNAAGRAVALALDTHNEVYLLNSSEPTHIRGGVLDLTFVSANLMPTASWRVVGDVVSDHFGTLTTLKASPCPSPTPDPAKWNFSKADWSHY